MKALILADRVGKELEPLTKKTCVALLPVAGKPVLEYAIESLVNSGIHEITLVISAYADDVEQTFGTGTRWGASFNYILSRGEEHPYDVITQRLNDQDEYLVLRGDILSNEIIAQTYKKDTPKSKLADFCWTKDINLNTVDNNKISYLESLKSYHQANLDVIAGKFDKLLVPGRELALGLKVGRKSQISPQSLKQGIAFVGSNSRIDRQAELLDQVVISDNVIIDRAATIESSVILPNTYIGEFVEIKNAIVWSNDLIRVDIDTVLHISDTFLLADLNTQTIGKSIAQPVNRLLGLILMILSLPLWLLAPIAALISDHKKILKKNELEGNRLQLDDFGNRKRRVFTAWTWNTPIPILRYLPYLWSTLTGDLRVVGVIPLTPKESAQRIEDWARVRDEAPIGLIGPSQLNLPANVPIEEKLMSDAFYARQRTTSKDISYLWQGIRALFSRKAWQI